MSTQTGIRPNEELHRFFASCRDETTTGREKFRLIKVSIENEQLVLADAKEAAGDWRADWARQVPSSVERGQPCYLLFRTDSKDDGGAFGWTLISWSPDDASVRDKMLYASTKATLRKEFGGGQIRDELHGTSGEEVNLDGYLRHLESAGAPGPRSSDEVERDEARLDWTSSTVAVDSKVCSMSGLAFPLADAALAALDRFRAGDVDYLQLAIDLDKEIVVLSRDHQGSCPASDLAQMVPADAPRYHLFRFKHSHEGDYMESNAFIYTMPGYNCSVKERMLYSSCKNSVVERLEGMGLEVHKKIEVESGSELTEPFLMEEFHPTKSLNRSKFAKPAPPNRGNRRMTKVPSK